MVGETCRAVSLVEGRTDKVWCGIEGCNLLEVTSRRSALSVLQPQGPDLV